MNIGSVEGGTGWYLVVLGHYRVVLVETLQYWVSIGRNWVSRWRNWLEIGGTESVWSRGWYWSVIDGAGHWVRRRQYWLFQGCTRSVRGGTGLFLVILGQYKAALDGALW